VQATSLWRFRQKAPYTRVKNANSARYDATVVQRKQR
jgi:hypothetical protein